VVYKALYKPSKRLVAIKVLGSNEESLKKEVEILG